MITSDERIASDVAHLLNCINARMYSVERNIVVHTYRTSFSVLLASHFKKCDSEKTLLSK